MYVCPVYSYFTTLNFNQIKPNITDWVRKGYNPTENPPDCHISKDAKFVLDIWPIIPRGRDEQIGAELKYQWVI